MKTQRTSTTKERYKALRFIGLGMIFLLGTIPMYAQQQTQQISGVVNSLDGPLLGATITLKGTATTVISNEDGAFTFPKELKQNDVLVVSYLGYETDEITITEDTTFVTPYLEDIPIVIVAELRTKHISKTSVHQKH